MFKLIAFFALLAVAFAAPEPKPDPSILAYTAGVPLTYGAIPSAYSWNNIYRSGYGLSTYAAAYPGYTSYNLPLAYSGLYY